MATYNKPGVYIQEVLSPNLPISSTAGDTVGAFIGIADRGPTTVVNGQVVGVPTLIESWDEFVNTFSFGAVVKTFDSTIMGVAPADNFIGTTTSDLKYALYSFFANGGTKAYVTRTVNSDATAASVIVSDVAGTSTIDASSNNVTFTTSGSGSEKIITVSSASGTPFASALAGNLVSFSGVVTNDAGANGVMTNNSFIISSVTNNKTIVLRYGGSLTFTATATTGIITVTGTSAGNNAIKISAKNPGAWGNNIWVGITPSQTPYYFDLAVYYGYTTDVTTYSATSSNLDKNKSLVETITDLSLNPADDRYIGKVLSSNWISVSDVSPTIVSTTGVALTRVPAFTGNTQWAANGLNATTSTAGTFKWTSANQVPNTPVRLGLGVVNIIATGPRVAIDGGPAAVTSTVSTTQAQVKTLPSVFFHDYVSGNEGTSSGSNLVNTLSILDSVPDMLVINYPNTFDQDSVKKLTTYAKSRGNSFVVVDSGVVTSSAASLSTLLDSFTITDPNYGAVYFPNLVYSDPGSNVVGKLQTISPGGAVVAAYCTNDSTRGQFKSPAGTSSTISGAVPGVALSNSDFDTLSNALKNVNVIRTVPGAGTCIMGARTIASSFADKYISVRRTLNELTYNLKNITEFALFEPNDPTLWNNISGIVSGYLNEYWAKGGLAGTIADDAFYVKCDGTINTPTVVASGELRIEVGVALQRPAEFVVIKIGQINGGTTVTTTI